MNLNEFLASFDGVDASVVPAYEGPITKAEARRQEAHELLKDWLASRDLRWVDGILHDLKDVEVLAVPVETLVEIVATMAPGATSAPIASDKHGRLRDVWVTPGVSFAVARKAVLSIPARTVSPVGRMHGGQHVGQPHAAPAVESRVSRTARPTIDRDRPTTTLT